MKRNSRKIISSIASLLLSAAVLAGALPNEIYNTENYNISVSAAFAYNIRYVLDGGKNDDANPSGFDAGSGSITLKAPTKKGYAFDGWSSAGFSSNQMEVTIDTSSSADQENKTYTAHWKANTYTVNFKANGAPSGSMDNMEFTYGQSKKFTKNAYDHPTGEYFKGWNTKSNGTGTLFEDESNADELITDSNTNITTPIEIYAQWAPISYTVKFHANGGTGEIEAQSFKYGESKNLTQNSFERKHYTFAGWAASSSSTSAVYTDQQAVSDLTAENNGVIDLYAVWTANTYKVVFNKNNADAQGTMTDQTFTYGSAAKLTANSYTYEGKELSGWNSKADGTGTAYADLASADSIVPDDAANNAAIELYAQWSNTKYSITYAGLDGITADSTAAYPTEFEITTPTITLPTPSKVGYTFDGWTEDNGTEKKKTGVTIPLGTHQNKTFTAHWTANNYTIKFDKNNTSATGTMADLSAVYGQNVTLTDNGFSLAGYKLKNWNTAAAGTGTSYDDKAAVKDLTSTKDENITLYAIWQPMTYKVVFNKNGGTGTNMSDKTYVYGTAEALPECTFHKTGKVFAGWGTSAGATSATYTDKQEINILPSADGAAVTLYAVWIDTAKFTVVFDENGGTDGTAMTDQLFTLGTAQQLKNCTFKRTGFTFSGWNTKNDGSGDSYSNKQSVKDLTTQANGTVTLYAQWSANTFTVTYNANGGTGGTPASHTVTYGQKITARSGSGLLTKKGYTFEGWSTKTSGAGDTYDEGAEITVTANLILYAKWTANSYTVKFDPNGGSGSMDALSCTYGASKALTANAFTRIGYKFDGWNELSGGTGKQYKDKASVQNLSETNNAIVTLYAQWKKKEYTIKFEKNSGTGTMSAQKFEYGDSSKITANAFTKANYDFAGWNTKADGKGTFYKDEESLSNLELSADTITLYAQWKTLKYTLSLPAKMEITGGTASSDGLYDKGATVKFTVSSGYTVSGDVKNGSDVLTPEDGIYSVTFDSSNITVSATIQKNKHTITYKVDGAVYKTVEAEYGSAITLISAPSKSGYQFSGWKNAPRQMPDNDIIITGTFTSLAVSSQQSSAPTSSSTVATAVSVTTGPLGKVTGIKVDSSGNVTWDALPGAVSYKAAKIVDKTTYYGKLTDKNSYKFTSLPKEDYQVFIIAYDADGKYTKSDKKTVKVNVKLGAVTGVTVNSEGVVTWDKTENAVSYVVVKTVGSKTYYGKSTTKTTYKFAVLPEVAYKVYVIATNANGETVASNVLTAYPNGTVIYPVTNVTATSSGLVTWTATENVAYYRVSKKYQGKTATSTKVTNTKYQFVNVPAGDFEVYVTAYNEKGNSAVSDTVKVKVSDVTPDKVIGVNADSDGNVSWTASNNAVYYRVSRVSDGKTVTSNQVKKLSYKFVSVPTTDFNVYVTAFSASGQKAVSDTVKVKVVKKVAAVKTVTIDSKGVIKWSAAANAVSYKVTRKCGSSTTYSKKITDKKYSFSSVPTTAYSVYITSYDEQGNYEKSEVINIDPEKMSPVAVSSDGTVTWTAAADAAYYKVSRVSTGILTTSKAVKDTKYKFVAVPSGSYDVYVTAYDASGNAVRSSTVKAG